MRQPRGEGRLRSPQASGHWRRMINGLPDGDDGDRGKMRRREGRGKGARREGRRQRGKEGRKEIGKQPKGNGLSRKGETDHNMSRHIISSTISPHFPSEAIKIY